MTPIQTIDEKVFSEETREFFARVDDNKALFSAYSAEVERRWKGESREGIFEVEQHDPKGPKSIVPTVRLRRGFLRGSERYNLEWCPGDNLRFMVIGVKPDGSAIALGMSDEFYFKLKNNDGPFPIKRFRADYLPLPNYFSV